MKKRNHDHDKDANQKNKSQLRMKLEHDMQKKTETVENNHVQTTYDIKQEGKSNQAKKCTFTQ